MSIRDQLSNQLAGSGVSGPPGERRSSQRIWALALSLLGAVSVACASAGPEDGTEVAGLGQELTASAGQATSMGGGKPTGAGGTPGAAGAPQSVGGSFPGGGPNGGAPSGGAGGGSGFSESVWNFEDCFRTSPVLLDTSVNAAHATRSASTRCVLGANGQGVQFKTATDIVEVGNRPAFALDMHLGVAAWVKPNNVTTKQTIIHKGGNNGESFALTIDNKRLVFTVGLRNGKSVTSSAPIKASKLTHVGGLYDGQFAFLFINGQQVGQVAMKGRIQNGKGPIQIGNNGTASPFAGLIDEVWFSSTATSAFDVTNRACIPRQAGLVVTPATSGLVPTDTVVSYEIKVTNNNLGCQADFFNFFFQGNGPGQGTEPGISTSVDTNFAGPVASGQTATFHATVSGSIDADPGVHQVPFDVFSNFNFLSGSLTYELAAPTGCFVRTSRELMLTSLSVVDDPVRTNFDGSPTDPRTGAWTFGSLVRKFTPTPEQAPAMVEQLFSTWLTDQQVNGFTITARPSIQFQLLDIWPRTANGQLDLDRSPLTLLAIVNRTDLRSLSNGHAGEGRFIFGVGQQFRPLQFTVILEYQQPATTEADVLASAQAWHALGGLPFPSEQYNTALQAITDRFTARNAAPGRPNGSALNQFRTNEIDLSNDGTWELREFSLLPGGFLAPSTIKLTPDRSFDGSPLLSAFVSQNETAILAEQHEVPQQFQGQSFLGGSVINPLDAWFVPGVSSEARHKFSLNTCNGCHSSAETSTPFLMVFPRFPGQESSLSPFLTGVQQPDPFDPSVVRNLNDLARRRTDLQGLVCAQPVAAPSQARMAAAPVAPAVNIAEGIRRVH